MRLPEQNQMNASVSMLSTFAGYNRNLRISDGEFSEMENLTADYYPVMSPRSKRGIITTLTNVRGLFGADKLVYVSDNKLYYNQSYACDLSTEYVNTDRMFVMMGAFLCVFPDKIMYNTYTYEVEYMENKVITATNPTFTLCKMDGTVYDSAKTYTGNTAPDTASYTYWIDTSDNTASMKMWSENTGLWVSVGTTYVKIAAAGIGEGFKEYDAVTLSGVDVGISAIYNNYNFNTSNILFGCDDDYIIVVGFINKVFQNSTVVTLERKVPDMDFVAEMDNRIWGCSSDNHEIYACKQGDPKNWNCFMGISSDSYAATIGSEGPFTGCVNYSGRILFFKDNGVHKLYGDKPSNYELNYYPIRGVQYGSERSMVVLNEVLYYKSREGICAYDGSTPSKISSQFGSNMYYEAVAGKYRDKYYVCMRDDDYQHYMFVYDTAKGMWMKEDYINAKGFAYADGGLYFVDDENVLYCINAEKIYTKLFPAMTGVDEKYNYPGEIYPDNIPLGTTEDRIEWSATTGSMGLNDPYNKYIRELIIRMEIDVNSYVRIDIMYDSSDAWEKLVEYVATRKRSYQVPVRVKRCDHMKLRISGKGDVKLYSIAQVIEEGSEISGC